MAGALTASIFPVRGLTLGFTVLGEEEEKESVAGGGGGRSIEDDQLALCHEDRWTEGEEAS
jgi:hypothetical protein